MKAFKTTRFKCDFCNRTLSSKKRMAEHEERCFYNPVSRSCGTCIHYHNEVEELGGCGYSGAEVSIKIQECCLHGKHLCHPMPIETQCDTELYLGTNKECWSNGE